MTSPPSPSESLSLDHLRSLDRDDPLASFREQFDLPAELVYLDGNSLGPLPRRTRERLRRVVDEEWGRSLIRSWNDHGWIDLPTRVGDKIGRLVGAAPGQVLVADSTSVNLFKVAAAALDLQRRCDPRRRVLLTEEGGFPTDRYILDSLASWLEAGHEVRAVPPEELPVALETAGDALALLSLTQVSYTTGRLHDLRRLTAAARDRGGLALWDLAHSAGALPVELDSAGVDFAVGCGYKYLNGGPGAPAFLYVARRHQKASRQPLAGWLGHAEPFAFEEGYRPAGGAARFLCGTPPILSLAALEEGVDLLLEADLKAVRAKSLQLGELFLRLVDERCAGLGLRPITPVDGECRGSQVSLRHPQGYPVMQALIARGVIGDFRAPDLLRFGLTPLTLRYRDLWTAVETLRQVLEDRAWDQPEYRRRARVT